FDRPDEGELGPVRRPLFNRHEVGHRGGAGLFIGAAPVAIARVDNKGEVARGVLGEAAEGGAAEPNGLRAGRGLNRAFGRPPLDVGAITGVHKVNPAGTDVSEVKAVEALAAQLEDAADLLSVEFEDFKPAVVEDAGEAQQDILN